MKPTTIREHRKLKTEKNLAARGHNVTVLWATVYQTEKYRQLVNVQCNKCGDIKETMLGNLSKGAYICNHCNELKYKSFIFGSNWKYVSHGAGRVELKCSACGNLNSADSSLITRGSTPHCDVCQINRYVSSCEKLNLTFLDKSNNGHTLIHTGCNSCGCISKTHSGDILQGRFRCSGCVLNNYKDALIKRNCTFLSIEKSDKTHDYIHYKNEHGDCFKAATTNVLSGRFEISLNGYWSHPHSVYLIKLQVEGNLFIYKIGTANDPERRAKSLKLNKNYEVFVLDSFETRFGADKLESELHSEFSKFRLKPEQTSEHTDSNVLRKYSDGKYHRVKDGITEWFSSEVYETLKVRYNLA